MKITWYLCTHPFLAFMRYHLSRHIPKMLHPSHQCHHVPIANNVKHEIIDVFLLMTVLHIVIWLAMQGVTAATPVTPWLEPLNWRSYRPMLFCSLLYFNSWKNSRFPVEVIRLVTKQKSSKSIKSPLCWEMFWCAETCMPFTWNHRFKFPHCLNI